MNGTAAAAAGENPALDEPSAETSTSQISYSSNESDSIHESVVHDSRDQSEVAKTEKNPGEHRNEGQEKEEKDTSEHSAASSVVQETNSTSGDPPSPFEIDAVVPTNKRIDYQAKKRRKRARRAKKSMNDLRRFTFGTSCHKRDRMGWDGSLKTTVKVWKQPWGSARNPFRATAKIRGRKTNKTDPEKPLCHTLPPPRTCRTLLTRSTGSVRRCRREVTAVRNPNRRRKKAI